jgi:hypothetical protein
MRTFTTAIALISLSLICVGCDGSDADTTADQQPQPQAAPAPPPDTPEGKARRTLDDVRQMIFDQKFAEAEKELAELQKTKGSLPPELQMEIENVHATMMAAKQTAQEGQPQPQPR